MTPAGTNPADINPVSPARALPAEAPLDMPRQPRNAPRLATRSRLGFWRYLGTLQARFLLLAGTIILATYGVNEMHAVMEQGGVTPLQWVFLGLFSINFAWISFAGCQAALGLFLMLKRDIFGRHTIHDRVPAIQTAVLMPVYNEDPVRVGAAVQAMAEGLAEKAPGQFCFFILSDTNRARAWMQEAHFYRGLIEQAPADCPVYYRHRANNAERKAGNIADWVMRWGGAYETMLVLDADSIMSPETIIEMARRMEADPGLGLLQTLPSIVHGVSFYARLQQFANRCYGLIFGNGLAAWHGNGSNFWGHNAIIRVKAFAHHARLPILSGKPPFGGPIMSHDFIEAALIRRAGWGVRFDTDLQGTYEEAPPSLSDVLVRDRRWCQGNLQHGRMLFARGLAFTTRLHLLSGMMAYLSALFWLLLLSTGLMLAIQASLTRPEYFARPSLFPTWPVFDSERAVQLFILSTSIVLAPKAFAWFAAMINPMRGWRYGGPILVTLSIMVEIVLSALYAPVMMLAQSNIVREVLTGGDSGWKPQRRGDGSIGLHTAFWAHRWHMLTGLAAAILTWSLHPDLFLWMLPVTGGLMLSPILSWASGKGWLGRLFKWFGILRTPEEKKVPPILSRMEAILKDTAPASTGSPLGLLATDTRFNAWHSTQVAGRGAVAKTFDPHLVLARAKTEQALTLKALEDWLTPAETMAFLNSAALVKSLPAWAKR